jgi:DNA polymerase I-like protein with 3'-5' exonuclease and polymerase domains
MDISAFDQLVAEGMRPKVEPYPWMKSRKFTLVKSLEQLKDVIDKAIEKGLCSLDLETTGLDNRLDAHGKTLDKIVGYCLSYDGKEGFYVPVRHVRRTATFTETEPHPCNLQYMKVEEEIKRLCENCVTIYHNSPFDHEFLFGSAVSVDIDKPSSFEDTLILTYLKDSCTKRTGLKYAAEQFLGMQMIELSDLFPPNTKSRNFALLDPQEQSTLWYAGSDGICTYELFQYYRTHNWKGEKEHDPSKTVYGEQRTVYNIEKALVPALRWMSRVRPKIDHKYLERLKDETQSLLDECIRDIEQGLVESIGLEEFKSGNFPYDVKSPDQLGKAFLLLKERNPSFAKAELPLTESGKQVSTDDVMLQGLVEKYGGIFPFIKKIQNFRTLQKVLGTYITPLYENTDRDDNPYFQGTHRLGDSTTRFEFRAWKTDTGRFAAEKGSKEAGYSGINVQSAPACGTYADMKYRRVLKRDKSIQHEETPVLDESFVRAVEEADYLRRVYDGHFIQEWESGDELCIRNTCNETCPFFTSCSHGKEATKKFWSIENAVRPSLKAREGYVLCAIDYAGLELRAAAAIANETLWIDEFNKGGKNADLHTITTKIIYGDDVENLPASELKAKRGIAKCIVGGSLVQTDKGLVRIKDLDPDSEPDTFVPFETPIKVWTEDGVQDATHFYNGGVQDTFRIETKGRYHLEGTGTHRIRAFTQDEGYCWKHLSDLKVGDYVVVDKTFNKGSKRLYTRRLGKPFPKKGFQPSTPNDDRNELALVQVIKITKGREQVYDLTVPVTNSFWANGFINHNSVNFAILYGGSGAAIGRSTGMTFDEGEKIKNDILTELEGLGRWMQSTVRNAHKTGEVKTATGRVIRLKEINSSVKWIKLKQERNAINSIVQGTATGDLIKYAMGAVYRKIKEKGWQDRCSMLLTMHDELVLEIRQDCLDEVLPVISVCMTEYGRKVKWPVPLETDVEFDVNWSPSYDWSKMRTINPKTGIAEAPFPPYLLEKIQLEAGMWYLDGSTKMVYKDGSFKEYKAEDCQKMTLTEASDIEDTEDAFEPAIEFDEKTEDEKPEKVFDPVVNPSGKDEARDTPSTPKKETSYPVYERKIHFPLTTKQIAMSFIVRQEKVIASCRSLVTLGLMKPSHLLRVITIQGEVLLSEDEGVLVDPDLFEILAFHEGI